MTHNDRALCKCGIRIPSARNRCPAFDKDKYLEPMLGDVGQARTNARICSYIPNFGQYKHDREGFTYDKTNDKYVCSQGKDLPFKKISTSSLGYQRKPTEAVHWIVPGVSYAANASANQILKK